MKITWYGTATIGIDDGKTKVGFSDDFNFNYNLPFKLCRGLYPW